MPTTSATPEAPLAADAFAADPRIATARQIFLDTLKDHQRQLIAIRPADPARKADYDQTIASFSTLRGGELYYPCLGSGIGNGPLVELADGSVKYDMISGIGIHYFGHGHPLVVAAALDAAISDIVMQGNLQNSGPFGLGAMIAFTPFDGSADTVKRVLHKLFERGVIAFLAGSSPTRIGFLPPIGTITEEDVDRVCGILGETLKSEDYGHR